MIEHIPQQRFYIVEIFLAGISSRLQVFQYIRVSILPGEYVQAEVLLITLEGIEGELDKEWERAGEPSGKMIAAALTVHLPILFASIIVFFMVPLEWIVLAVERARKTDWEELRQKIRW